MKVSFYPRARLEYREAAAFYEDRKQGLGLAFTRDIEATLQKILQTPERWRLIEKNVHRCMAEIFPYSILSTVQGNGILVVAVMHQSRRPGY